MPGITVGMRPNDADLPVPAAMTCMEESLLWLTITTDDGAPVRVLPVAGNTCTIGRERTADVVIDDEKASRLHCRLHRQATGDTELVDLGSTNGTRVDGVRAGGPVVLHGGESIRIGRHTIVVSKTDPATGGRTVIELPSPVAAAVGDTVAAPRKTVPLARVLVGLGTVAVVGVGLFALNGRSSGELSTPKIIDIARSRTVSVTTDIDGASYGRGSGWVLDAKNGLIVTNHHVANAGSSLTVGLNGGKRPATIIGTSVCDDLTVLKVNDIAGLQTMELSSQGTLHQGDKVVAVGYPGNVAAKPELQANAGIVSVVKTEWVKESLDVAHLPNVVQTDAAINPGNSGGPLLDTHARLVGVNSAHNNNRENQAFAIGVDRVKEVTDKLREGTSYGWTGLGIIEPGSESDFTDFKLPVVKGGLVAWFAAPLTPAANLSISRKPFIIVAINGTKMDGTKQGYCAVVGKLSAGDSATFTTTIDGTTGVDIKIPFA